MTEDSPCTHQASCVAYIAAYLKKRDNTSDGLHHFNEVLAFISYCINIAAAVLFFSFTIYFRRRIQQFLPDFNWIKCISDLVGAIRLVATKHVTTDALAETEPSKIKRHDVAPGVHLPVIHPSMNTTDMVVEIERDLTSSEDEIFIRSFTDPHNALSCNVPSNIVQSCTSSVAFCHSSGSLQVV